MVLLSAKAVFYEILHEEHVSMLVELPMKSSTKVEDLFDGNKDRVIKRQAHDAIVTHGSCAVHDTFHIHRMRGAEHGKRVAHEVIETIHVDPTRAVVHNVEQEPSFVGDRGWRRCGRAGDHQKYELHILLRYTSIEHTSYDKFAHPLVRPERVNSFVDVFLEQMGERSVPHVVQQPGKFQTLHISFRHDTIADLHQMTAHEGCKMSYTDRMFQPCVRRGWIDERTSSQLTDCVETLHLWTVEKRRGDVGEVHLPIDAIEDTTRHSFVCVCAYQNPVFGTRNSQTCSKYGMLAVEISVGRAPVSVAPSGPSMRDTDECLDVREQLRNMKRRVPQVQQTIGMKQWYSRVNTTSPMERRNSNRQVVNRAYHKMNEIVLSCALKNTRRSAHLCEAPGGFVQCVGDTIADSGGWEWIAITLQTTDAPVPSDTLLPFEHGSFVYANVLEDAEYCVARIGTVDLVTADGAVMMDHDHIERAHHDLLDVQSWIALRCLEKGGTYIVKAFECLEAGTRRTIAWVSSHFESTAVIKPFSSRVTNSERYLVFRGFNGYDGTTRSQECFVAQGWDERCQHVMSTLARRQLQALGGAVMHQNVVPKSHRTSRP